MLVIPRCYSSVVHRWVGYVPQVNSVLGGSEQSNGLLD